MQINTTAKQVINDAGSVPIKIWTDEVEEGAMMQLKNLARLPFIAKQGIAVMPDVHKGIGATIDATGGHNFSINPGRLWRRFRLRHVCTTSISQSSPTAG